MKKHSLLKMKDAFFTPVINWISLLHDVDTLNSCRKNAAHIDAISDEFVKNAVRIKRSDTPMSTSNEPHPHQTASTICLLGFELGPYGSLRRKEMRSRFLLTQMP